MGYIGDAIGYIKDGVITLFAIFKDLLIEKLNHENNKATNGIEKYINRINNS